jgi:hypothetical protein
VLVNNRSANATHVLDFYHASEHCLALAHRRQASDQEAVSRCVGPFTIYVAPNTRPDGSDNPEGRTRNRRIAVIIPTR